MDETFLKELLECSVCLEQLDTSSRVLPCQHTFCRRCLEDIVSTRKELRCPECRVLVETKVEDLPGNILLIRLLDGMKNKPQIKTSLENVTKDSPALGISNNNLQYSPPKLLHSQNIRQTAQVGDGNRAVVKQSSRCYPCAKALYTYEGKEPGDLSFKKGDTIVLQRKINQNWYHGELNGKFGFVPSSYVRVVLLRTHVPQCKALYDFNMSGSDEKDCLTFRKGEVITVIRRIDDNWAEGKLFDKIGIFPISFVEMNVAARSLLKLSTNTQSGPSRVAPPTPITNLLATATPKSVVPSSREASQEEDSLTSATVAPSSSSSSCTSSPSSPPSSSSSSSVSQPVPAVTSVQVAEKPFHALIRSASQRNNIHREKRHSLSSLSMSPVQKSSPVSAAHEHSTEILTTAGGDVLAAPNRSVSVSSADSALNTSNEDASPKSVKSSSRVNSVVQDSSEIADANSGTMSRMPTKNSRAAAGDTPVTSQSSTSVVATNSTSTQPVICMALFNCKPEKDDELLLKKGEYYTVTEKYQDGWFKGTSLRTGRSGVFPGNYVQISKLSSHQSPLAQDLSRFKAHLGIGLKTSSPVVVAPPRQKSLPSSAQAFSSISAAGNEKNGPQPQVAIKNATAKESRNPFAAELLECTRRLPSASSPFSSIAAWDPFSPLQEHNIDNDVSHSIDKNLVPWMSKLQLSTSSAGTTNNVPASSSTTATASPATFSSSSAHAQSSSKFHPSESPSRSPVWQFVSHSRRADVPSSNAPSMSVMSPPNVTLSSPVAFPVRHPKSEKMRKDRGLESVIKRISGKKRPRRLGASNFWDNPSFVDPTDSSTQARAGPCTAEAAQGQFKSGAAAAEAAEAPSSISSHSKHSLTTRERFRCVVPYPPNSEYELELKIGDIVYVHKKREDGWYKGTLARTGKTGLFPASFVDTF